MPSLHKISRRSHPANSNEESADSDPTRATAANSQYSSRGPVHCLRTRTVCLCCSLCFYAPGEPPSHPPPTAAPKVTKPACRAQTRPAPELPLHTKCASSPSIFTRLPCLTEQASHDASLSLAYAYLILLLVRTRHLVAAHLTLHLTSHSTPAGRLLYQTTLHS